MKILPLNYLKIWQTIGYLLVILVITLSVISPSSNSELFKINDKIGHFFAYSILMGWFAQWHEKSHFKYLAIVFIMLGISLEIVQTFLPERMGDVNDVIVNSLGVFVAWGLANTALGRILFHFENLILRK